MSGIDRVRAMADRLRRELNDAGAGATHAANIIDAFQDATRRREVLVLHDFELLHPGRNILILLRDCGSTDAVELSAAAHFDRNMPPTRTGDSRIDEMLRAVPHPAAIEDEDRLLEELVTAAPAPRRIALADALDHARHLHMRPDADRLAEFEMFRDVYRPVAERTDPALARRFTSWAGMFERRRLRLRRPPP